MISESPIRVLCVDDDPALLQLWERSLAGTSVVIRAEREAMGAVDALETQRFDVVLCDYRMPLMDGIDVLALARERSPEASLVMISAQADLEMAMSAINRVGVFRLLTKPIRIVELRAIILEGAEAARLRKDNKRLTKELAERNAALEDLNAALQARASSQAMHAVCGMLRALGLFSEQHSRRAGQTAATALCIAQHLELSRSDRLVLDQGALLHDVGLLAVPRSLLLQPGPLDLEAEFELRNHVAVGKMLVQELNLGIDVQRIVSEHHEHWDGTGYPGGLSGEKIHWGARIVGVCDGYVSLTQGGPFQTPLSHTNALLELKQWSGLRYDPSVVVAICSIPQAELDKQLSSVATRPCARMAEKDPCRSSSVPRI